MPSLARRFGGPRAKALGLARAIRACGHRVSVIGCDDAGASASAEIRLAPLAHFHSTPIPRRLAPIRRAVAEADVVHVLGFRDPVGTAAARAARRRDIPYVLEPEGMLSRGGRSGVLKGVFDATIGRSVVAGASAIVVTSSLEASRIELPAVSPGVMVRPNGVDATDRRGAPGAFRRRLALDDATPLLLSIGRISKVKRLDLFVAVVAALPSVHGVIAGVDERDGALAAIRRAITTHGVGERMTLITDGLWDHDKEAALADADVFVLASASESFGLAAAEAACAGVPVVATDACGVIEWLPPACCTVVPSDNARALADGISEALHKREDATRAERARAALDVLAWDAVAPMQVAAYERLRRS